MLSQSGHRVIYSASPKTLVTAFTDSVCASFHFIPSALSTNPDSANASFRTASESGSCNARMIPPTVRRGDARTLRLVKRSGERNAHRQAFAPSVHREDTANGIGDVEMFPLMMGWKHGDLKWQFGGSFSFVCSEGQYPNTCNIATVDATGSSLLSGTCKKQFPLQLTN